MNQPGEHKLTEAIEGQIPPAADAQAAHPGQGGHQTTTPNQTAEEARRRQESSSTGKHDADRDGHLTRIGRGDQTHG